MKIKGYKSPIYIAWIDKDILKNQARISSIFGDTKDASDICLVDSIKEVSRINEPNKNDPRR